MMIVDDETLSRGWFGHGSWAAPFWFIGMEPGGDEAASNLALWQQAGCPEFTDITVTHPAHPTDYFGPDATPQQTWQKLIWLVLAFNGIEPTAEASLAYQRNSLARGETTLLELSPFAAKTTNTPTETRLLGRDRRIEIIRERMLRHQPTFLVCYSMTADYVAAWEQIAGTHLAEGHPVLVGSTAVVATYHPNRERSKAYWIEIARRLRARRPTEH